ncbi:MAG TPA: hypothetical protein VEU73_09405 [Gemmatimonadales bacterium]|nr:hypothetical protein [Gemmatimonadales bacterium]
MPRSGFALVAATLGTVAGVAPLGAQGSDALYARFNALTGWEVRGYTFDPWTGANAADQPRSVSQWSLPLVVAAPLGRRLSVDLTTRYASAKVESFSGARATLSGFTDTQVRFLYTMNRDRLVGSLSFNLPTGQATVDSNEFRVAGAIGGNYLSFPVPNFGTAFGVTGGVAYAQHVGTWNVGLSSSLRYLSTYKPFVNNPLSYNPGVEGRFRIGADRLFGQASRLLLGLTVSTFSTDTYSGSTTAAFGPYGPGTRFITELVFMRVVGRATVGASAWDYYRVAGDSAGTPSPQTKENVFNSELRVTYPVSPRLQIEPLLAFRQWSPADYRGGRLTSGGLLVRGTLSDRLSATVQARYDGGWIYAQSNASAVSTDLRGYGASVFLRYER